jgi:hypothetical protein
MKLTDIGFTGHSIGYWIKFFDYGFLDIVVIEYINQLQDQN